MLDAFCGSSPELQTRHLNDERADNRLENLCWGTAQENKQDALANGRVPLGEDHPNVKLDAISVREVRKLRAAGLSYAKIAESLPVSEDAVRLVCIGRTWKHVK